MDIVNMHKVEKTHFTDPIFTGSEVTIQELLPGSEEYRINIVNFGKGVRNKLHYHDAEQILVITGGTGIVATEDEERIVTVCDIVRIPADEKHWHGATEDSEFSHIYVMRKDSTLTRVEE